MISDEFGSGSWSGPPSTGGEPGSVPSRRPSSEHWAGRLRSIDLRERELTYRDLTHSPSSGPDLGNEAPPLTFDPAPTGHVASPAARPTIRISEPTEAFAVPTTVEPEAQSVTWRHPTQRTDDVAARNGQAPLPGWHQAALVVIAALGTGSAAFLLSGDTWGRTPMAVAALIGIPGLAAISLVAAQHRLRPAPRASHPAVAAALGVGLALASLAAVSLLGAWGALAVIAALVALAWWASSASRRQMDVRDDAGRPMAPAGGRPSLGGPVPAVPTSLLDHGPSEAAPHDASTLVQMMDVFAPDLPGDRTMPPLELTRTPAERPQAMAEPPIRSGAAPAEGGDATDDLLGWIADTYSPLN